LVRHFDEYELQIKIIAYATEFPNWLKGFWWLTNWSSDNCDVVVWFYQSDEIKVRIEIFDSEFKPRVQCDNII
jgi:hypothetical protein